jgi:hypothetical protein
MASPEHSDGRPDHPNHEPHAEGEPPPYLRAARFAGERPAGQAYFSVQRVIYEAPERTDLSVFRLQLDQLWHVAALGITPPATVLHAIEDILASGEPVTLPDDVVTVLTERRAQAIRQGSWSERHFRPGQPL